MTQTGTPARSHGPGRACLAYGTVLLLATLLARSGFLSGNLRWLWAEWWMWLLAAQIAGLAVILRAWGLPRSGKALLGVLLPNGVVLGVVWLLRKHLLADFLLVAGELLLRGGVTAAWGVLVLGPAWIAWRRARGRPANAPLPAGRLWCSAMLALVLLEPAARVLETRQPSPSDDLKLPARLAGPSPAELRIAAIGGSTMAGYPYQPRFGIPFVVGQQLEQRFPDRRVVVENVAEEGVNFRQAAERMSRLKARPHLLLVYTGHNEFFHDVEELRRPARRPFAVWDRWLAYSPTFRMFDRVLTERALLLRVACPDDRRWVERHIASPEMYQRRLERFRRQLRQLAGYCRSQAIATLWFIPAGTESGFDPNRTVFPDDIDEAGRQSLRELLDAADDCFARADWADLERVCRRGLERLPEGALFHFYLGEALLHSQHFDQAALHYRAALEADGHPIRANADYRRAVADVAAEFAIPTLDAAAVVRPLTPHGILDETVFLDHVHPNLRAHYALGTAAAELAMQTGLLGPSDDRFADEIGSGNGHESGGAAASNARGARLDFHQLLAVAALTADDLAAAYRREADAFLWLERWRRGGALRARRAEQFARWSQELQAGTLLPGEAGTEAVR